MLLSECVFSLWLLGKTSDNNEKCRSVWVCVRVQTCVRERERDRWVSGAQLSEEAFPESNEGRNIEMGDSLR